MTSVSSPIQSNPRRPTPTQPVQTDPPPAVRSKPLPGGATAVLLVNNGRATADVSVALAALNVSCAVDNSCRVRQFQTFLLKLVISHGFRRPDALARADPTPPHVPSAMLHFGC